MSRCLARVQVRYSKLSAARLQFALCTLGRGLMRMGLFHNRFIEVMAYNHSADAAIK
jgi:hypothetical protein